MLLPYGNFYIFRPALVRVSVFSDLFSSPVRGSPDVYDVQILGKMFFHTHVPGTGRIVSEAIGVRDSSPAASCAQ